ncbi:hypothetical protein RIF29_17177 [Crotalaria pallida]|uniref:Exocyst subunit Exo70 family protein n=1 Tax=Crotalaria pallida TaxID=3830 RepID=A0AAN9FK22_CROPI
MQPPVCRFVGFVSSVVGLLCYALSSSFNHLFGHWNFLKIFIYSCFSFIIIFMTMFAKVWQFSTSSTLFKTRMAVLVLLATTVYSYFYDKAVNQKPDAYIVISCAAFAFMSLSLSKQSQCGCEVDLLNFFLGCLTLLLMKINLWLFFVGAGFSYSLIILRSSLDATPQSGFSEDYIAIQVDSQEVNTNSAIQVDSQHINTESANQMDSQQVNGALTMTQFEACVSELKREDWNIIHKFDMYLGNLGKIEAATDENLLIDLLPPETINSLQETVKLMVAADFEEECCHVYSNCRKQFLQKSSFQFQLTKFDSDEFLYSAIQNWIRSSQIALRILFPCERRLCQNIFYGFSSAVDLSFMETCRELTNDILSFPNKLAIERYSLDDSGSYLDMILSSCLQVFRTLGDFIPEFESVFSDDYIYSVSLKNEAISSWKRLGETIRLIFMELESHLCRDVAQKPAPNGGIDPVTHHVKSCLGAVFDGRDALEQVFKEYPIPMVADGNREPKTSSFSNLIARIMELLYNNLEAKSKNSAEPALGYVFLMNNYKYILFSGKYDLETILGNDWFIKHTTKMQQNLEDYQRTWDKVLEILKLDDNEAEESMKEKLKLFNMQFKETCSVQSTWFLLNGWPRIQIRIYIEKLLLPTYGNFIGKFQSFLGKDADKFVEYGMYDIDALLNDLFRGSSGLESAFLDETNLSLSSILDRFRHVAYRYFA